MREVPVARKINPDRPAPIVRYAPVPELKVYELSEAELERLASGSPGQLQLNFALALLPAALTMLVTLQTVEIADGRIYYGYWIAFWAFLVQGVMALVRWRLTAGSARALVQEIRSRMPSPNVVPEQLLSPAPPPDADG